jgi:DNA-binding transcriptional regulator YdaS (Cro superfamily)
MAHDQTLATIFQRAGSASELARRLGISPAAVLQWDKVPANRVLVVEQVTGISRHMQRPDIFGEEPREPREAAE